MRALQATPVSILVLSSTFLSLFPLGCYHVDEQNVDLGLALDSGCDPCNVEGDSSDITVYYDSDSNVFYDTAPEDTAYLNVDSEVLPEPNYCLSLDGDEDYLRVDFSSELLITRNWTLEGWVKYYDNNRGVQPVLRLGDGNTSIGSYFLYAKYISGYPMGGWGVSDSYFNDLESDSPLPTDQWTHLAVTHSLGTQQFFVNGVLQAENSYDDDAYEIYDDLLIGGVRHPNLTGYVEGFIDDVRISSTVRYIDSFTPSADYPIDDHTVAQWTFQSETGDATYEDNTNTVSSALVGDAHLVER